MWENRDEKERKCEAKLSRAIPERQVRCVQQHENQLLIYPLVLQCNFKFFLAMNYVGNFFKFKIIYGLSSDKTSWSSYWTWFSRIFFSKHPAIAWSNKIEMNWIPKFRYGFMDRSRQWFSEKNYLMNMRDRQTSKIKAEQFLNSYDRTMDFIQSQLEGLDS